MLPAFVRSDEALTNKIASDVFLRLANDLMDRLNLLGLCE
jgi:hypothetical protein